MSNYFTLELDTTAPDIAVYGPSYVVTGSDTEIVVQGSEALAPYQAFYFIDAAGQRYDVIFDYMGDHFRGLIDFANLSLGIATFYAQVKDEMHNPSKVASLSINVRLPAPVNMLIAAAARTVAAAAVTRDVVVGTDIRGVVITTDSRDVVTTSQARTVAVDTAHRVVDTDSQGRQATVTSEVEGG